MHSKKKQVLLLVSKNKTHILEQKSPQFGSGGKQQTSENLFCIYCKRWNHSKGTCFKLKNRNQRQGQAHAARTHVNESPVGDVSCSDQPKKATQGQTDDVAILKEKLKKLEAMFASTSMALTGEYIALLGTHTSMTDQECILDFGATHHMIPVKSKFISPLYVIPQDKSSQLVWRFYMSVELEVLRLMELASVKTLFTYQTYQHSSSLRRNSMKT